MRSFVTNNHKMKINKLLFTILLGGVLLQAQEKEQKKDSIVVTSLEEVIVDGYFGVCPKR